MHQIFYKAKDAQLCSNTIQTPLFKYTHFFKASAFMLMKD